MSSQTLIRCGVALFLSTLVAGCSLLSDSPDEGPAYDGGARGGSGSACTAGGCMYEGRYEPGEASYAEEEAKRLNRASLERLRRNSIR